MKKNISINISGIIFYIEEDGYEKLKDYLDSINRYFAKFDDSSEIVSDIESRIAEIFLARLKDGRQVIQLEDVESLIATMGSIRDFKAVEEPEDDFFEEKKSPEARSQTGEGYKSRRLYRDKKRKAIAGVAAGIGHYFNIDPVWIRIIFIVFFVSFLFESSISLAIIVLYGALWIALPPSDELTYEKKFKKMYRNPDDKVLGGVASGVAAYFGVDAVVIRLLFIIFTFIALSGLIAYLILWLILPEAKTITDKMEMQGEPVTLSNIEANIKRSLNMHEGEENIYIKILLFPFRIIAALINGISRNFGPFLRILVHALRIIAGIVITMTGLGLLISLIVVFGLWLGMFTGSDFISISGLPFEFQLLEQTIPVIAYISVFVFLFVPFLVLTILGLMIVTSRSMLRPLAGWSLFAIWVASVFALAISLIPVVSHYRVSEIREEVHYFDVGNRTLLLKLRPRQPFSLDDYARLNLKGYNGKELKLVKTFEARGKTPQEALQNTRMVTYQVQQSDTILAFDQSLQFNPGTPFRVQRVSTTLYIPYGQKFVMDYNISWIMRNDLRPAGYSNKDIKGNTWTFTEEGLNCITCQEGTSNKGSKTRK